MTREPATTRQPRLVLIRGEPVMPRGGQIDAETRLEGKSLSRSDLPSKGSKCRLCGSWGARIILADFRYVISLVYRYSHRRNRQNCRNKGRSCVSPAASQRGD